MAGLSSGHATTSVDDDGPDRRQRRDDEDDDDDDDELQPAAVGLFALFIAASVLV